MARPRKPEDPERWRLPCFRCGGHYELVVTWPDGYICGDCYQAAKRTTGICACGHEGVLPGVIDGRPACRRCSGVKLNVDCISCGAEARSRALQRWTMPTMRARRYSPGIAH